MSKIKPMLVMMKMFARSLVKYRGTLGKQDAWLKKYAGKAGLSLNKDPMFNTNLKLWLSEAEDLFGKRICPCFSPTGDRERDKALLCPCRYLEGDIREKGTCHCTLFAPEDAAPGTYKKAMNRLMGEYQTPFYRNEEGEIDIRRYPLDEARGLRVPDAYHLAKRAAASGKGEIRLYVEHPYEVEVLETWSRKNGFGMRAEEREGGFSVRIER